MDEDCAVVVLWRDALPKLILKRPTVSPPQAKIEPAWSETVRAFQWFTERGERIDELALTHCGPGSKFPPVRNGNGSPAGGDPDRTDVQATATLPALPGLANGAAA